MFIFILGINIALIIIIFNFWQYYVKYDCYSHNTHDRWKKNVGYNLLKDKYALPKQQLLLSPINYLPDGFKYPVVLKPTDQGKGRDVYTDINTDKELFIISTKLLSYYKDIVLENQILNKRECRVLINTKVGHISITERLPIAVTGNGINNIKELVKIQNKKNKKRKNHYNDYHAIIIDERIVDKNTIPKLGEFVIVNNRKNSSLGGDIRIMDIKKVHPDNIKLFYNILDDIGSTHNGLDILFDDLSVSHKIKPIYLLETNFCPGLNKKRIMSPEFASARHSFYAYTGIGLLLLNAILSYTNPSQYSWITKYIKN